MLVVSLVSQVCRSDGDIKSALQAWCAYGHPGCTPAALFKPASTLRHIAFSPASDPSAPPPPAASASSASATSASASASASAQQQPSGKLTQGSHTLSGWPACIQQPSGLQTHAQQGAHPSGTQQPPGPQAQTQKQAASSANAFTVLMQATKVASQKPTAEARRTPPAFQDDGDGQTSVGAPRSAGIREHCSEEAPGRGTGPKASWQDALQRIAANPER